MREYQKPRVETEEGFEKHQMQEWLADSHYWVNENDTFHCKWCGRLTTTSLEFDAKLCPKNPELLKLLSN